jgi:hypothetical protein
MRDAKPGEAAAQAEDDPRSGLALWVAWARRQPLLAAALVGFCVVAIVGLFLTVPRGAPSVSRAGRTSGGASSSLPEPVAPSGPPASRPADAPAETSSSAPGAWVGSAPSIVSGRGLALVYRYRTLPPGGESRYEWIVQVQGPRRVLDGVEVVTWRMEPAAKNGEEFLSRDRAADGFPLFGDGPGGWFGVSAAVRFRDGAEETLTRRIELSDD